MEKYSTTGIRQMKKSVYHICLDSTLFVICRDDLFLELDPFSVLAWFIRINSSQCPKKIFERYLKSLNLETHLLSVSANGLLLDLRCYSGTLAFFSPHYNTAKGLLYKRVKLIVSQNSLNTTTYNNKETYTHHLCCDTGHSFNEAKYCFHYWLHHRGEKKQHLIQ